MGRRSQSHRRWQAEKAKEVERQRLRARDGEEPDPRAVGIRAKSHGCPCRFCRAVAAEFKYDRTKERGWKREVMAA